jgi:glyoxylase-like metal-dependent hydrolase (beta-lactamase superfamily II)
MQVGGYEIDIVLQGCPGKAVCHGGLGWSSVVLLKGHAPIALIDAGSFGLCAPCCCRGCGRDLKPTDVTDLLLPHSHHDHSVNWTLLRHARILIGAQELAWSVNEPWVRRQCLSSTCANLRPGRACKRCPTAMRCCRAPPRTWRRGTRQAT